MIGKTNALAGVANIKYASGTGTWAGASMRVEGLDFTPLAVIAARPSYPLGNNGSFYFIVDGDGNFLNGSGYNLTPNASTYNIFKSGCSVFKGGFTCGAYGTISGSAEWIAMGV